jgi:hypothetical protein
VLDIQELLGHYTDELRASGQDDEAERIGALAATPRTTSSRSSPRRSRRTRAFRRSRSLLALAAWQLVVASPVARSWSTQGLTSQGESDRRSTQR